MKKTLSSLVLFLLLTLTNTAFAHTDMVQTSFLHLAIHFSIVVGIYLAMMVAGLYLFRRLPRLKTQRIRIKK